MLKICLISKEQASHKFQCDKPSADINVISEENTSYDIMVERFRLTSTKRIYEGVWCVDGFVLCLQLRICKETGWVKSLFNIFCLYEEHVMRAFLRY